MRKPTTMSTEQVARKLEKYLRGKCSCRSVAEISKLCKQGKLRAEKVQGKWRITEANAAKVWPAIFEREVWKTSNIASLTIDRYSTEPKPHFIV